MNDYTGTGRKEENCLSCGVERWAGLAHYCDPIITNLRCWNCDLSLSPAKSEYEKPDYRCPGCDKVQINKTISPERSEGRRPAPTHEIDKDDYGEYLASYHGEIAPLTRGQFKELKNRGKSPSSFYGITEKISTHTHSPNPKDQIATTKLPLHLIPPPALARLSLVMQLGAKKYGAYNWRETEINLTIYLTAALRHIYSILDGEDIDSESGQHHAAHFMACAAIILDAIEVGKLIDDRSAPGNFAQLVTQLQEKKNEPSL